MTKKKSKNEAAESIERGLEQSANNKTEPLDATLLAVDEAIEEQTPLSESAKIRQQIKELLPLTHIPTAEEAGIPERDYHKSYEALVIRKRQAEAEIERLEALLAVQDQSNVKVVLLKGDPSQELLDALEAEGVIVLDALEPFEYAARRLIPMMDQVLSFGERQYAALLQHLRDDSRYEFIQSLPRPVFKHAVCHTERGLACLLRDVLDDDRACEGEFVSLILKEQAKAAIARSAWEGVIPVVVVNRQDFKIKNLTDTTFALLPDSTESTEEIAEKIFALFA